MRILHLATTYPLHERDSNAAFVEAMAEGLAERGHEVEVLVPWHPQLQLRRPGRRARVRAFRYSPLRAWHPWGYAQALRADRRLRPDAYLAALPAALAAGLAMRRARGAFDLLHAHWLLPNAPIVVSCHGSGVYLAERAGWARAAARFALRRAAAVTGCSADLVARVGRLGVGPPPERLPYGVHVERFRPLASEERRHARRAFAERWALPPEGEWILAVGRLVYKKGFDVLVDAFARCAGRRPRAVLVIVGDGPLAAELAARARAAGVAERVFLPGAAAHADLPAAYAAADVVCVPSVRGPGGNVDGLPNTLLEALASGTPVVASRIAGIPDVVEDGDNGLLVAEADAAALAAALERVLGSPLLARELGRRARAHAERELAWQRVAARLEQLYLRVLGRAVA